MWSSFFGCAIFYLDRLFHFTLNGIFDLGGGNLLGYGNFGGNWLLRHMVDSFFREGKLGRCSKLDERGLFILGVKVFLARGKFDEGGLFLFRDFCFLLCCSYRLNWLLRRVAGSQLGPRTVAVARPGA